MPKSNERQSSEFDARRNVAKGSGTVFLARTGSAIEIITQPAYTWMFGLATYGLYTVLWSLVNLIQNIADLAMTHALQRLLPKTNDAEVRAAIIKGAFVLGILPSVLIALVLSFFTADMAGLFNVADNDLAQLQKGIALFIWALPLWSIVKVTTSALRACQVFGPEIRLRLVWEQVLRLGLAIGLWIAAADTLALLLAHLGSLIIIAFLSLRLLNSYCNLKHIWQARLSRNVLYELYISGLSVLPANILARMFSDMPVIIVNFMLPGASGANAAGLYSIARKLSSIPQLIRTVFAYVISPITVASVNRGPAARQALYEFSIRISLLLALPTSAVLILLADAILVLFATGAAAAWPIVVILTIARGIEASVGPATAIQHVISHRGLPILNTLLGFITTTIILFISFPMYQTVGVALGVAAGQIVIAVLAVWQLHRFEKLHAFGGQFMRIFIGALATCFIILAANNLAAPGLVQNAANLSAYLSALWLNLRFVLPEQDRLALGKVGRKLGLIVRENTD